jgi:hypothetical protein
MSSQQLPALPQSHALLMADQLLHDSITGKISVIGLFHNVHPDRFPFHHRNWWLYAVVSEIHGPTSIIFRLLRSADDSVLFESHPIDLTATSPLEVAERADRVLGVVYPAPGEYRLEAVVGGEVIAVRRYHVHEI